VPPAEGEPLVKTSTVDGTQFTYKYCGRCRRWRAGDKAHTTDEHRARADLPSTLTQVPNNQGNVGHVSAAGNLGLSFGLGGLFVGTLDLSAGSVHPLLGNTEDFLQDIYASSTATFYNEYSVNDDSVQMEPTASSSEGSFGNEASTNSSTIRFLLNGLVLLGAGTRPDTLSYWSCAVRAIRHALDSSDPN
jgi:hypothetical protein